MNLHFESDLKYQADAIEAVCGLFMVRSFAGPSP
jgi:hypothetical protein